MANDAALSIAILRNPLDPARRELLEAPAGGLFIDWLTAHFPQGFGGAITLLRNGREIEIAEADFLTEPGDVVTVIVHPGGQIEIGALIVKAIIGAIISAAASLVFNLIFSKPKGPAAQSLPQADPIYTISGAQNAARIGDPIPALYGRMMTTPDYGSQPYTYFDGNNQFIAQILVIGWGEYQLNDVLVGATPVSAMQSDAVAYWLFGPNDHAQVMGRIEAATGVMENVVSSAEVSDQEFGTAPPMVGDTIQFQDQGAHFIAPNTIRIGLSSYSQLVGFTWLQVTGTSKNDRTYSIAGFSNYSPTQIEIYVNERTVQEENLTNSGLTAHFVFYNSTQQARTVGPFITSKPGTRGNRIMADFVFPQGLYDVDQNSGGIAFMSATFEIQYQPLDDAGNPIGGFTSFPVSISRATTTPVRITISVDVPAGRYRVQVVQTSPPPPSARAQATFIWSALKFRLVNAPGQVYGQTSLLVLRIRATNGISSNASSRIMADVTKRLPALGQGPNRPTRDPADAFVDIYTNPIYGARRPLSEVDIAELARLQAHWAGQAHFDGGFAQKSTIWEALGIVMQTAGAAPLPLGQLMSVAQDGVKALRTQLFSDANMKKGSLSIGYSFDKPGDPDGIRCEYRDPATWNPLYALWPASALDPDAVQLFGCTDGTQALQFARLLWQKRQGQRKTASFETELEGLIPRLGDRVAIATQLPRWARAGVVSSIRGNSIWIDEPPDWTAATGWFVVLRGQYGQPSDPIPISPGNSPYEVVLAYLPPFALFGTGSQEPTHYALGTAVELIADFTVANIEHQGGAGVTIEALHYEPGIFAGTLPWMEQPI